RARASRAGAVAAHCLVDTAGRARAAYARNGVGGGRRAGVMVRVRAGAWAASRAPDVPRTGALRRGGARLRPTPDQLSDGFARGQRADPLWQPDTGPDLVLLEARAVPGARERGMGFGASDGGRVRGAGGACRRRAIEALAGR